MRNRAGFTLIELLITVVIIGILAAIASMFYSGVKERAMSVTLKSDLRVISIQQEIYFPGHQTYAGTWSVLHYNPSAHVTMNITYAAPDGWAAQATHAAHPGHLCGIFFGAAPAANGAPATEPGVITCTS